MGRSSPYVSLDEERRQREKTEPAGPAVPFFILTGFLGAGKTTLLNRLLSAPQGRRIAVLVNDVGAINVDRRLLQAEAGDIIELSGGCVCCKVDLQRDLFTGVDDLVERARPDVVILETTGIADPAVLLTAFDEVHERRGRVVPSGVVCVLDAEVGIDGRRRPEWRAQVAAADRYVLTKVDRASPASLGALHDRLAELAPDRERAAFPPGEEGTQALARFLLTSAAPRRRAPAQSHVHGQLMVASFVEDSPLLEAPLRELVEGLGDRLVRMKGWARVVGENGARWVYAERAGLQTQFVEQSPPAEVTRTSLVFIVEAGAMDEEVLRRRLWACRTSSLTG